MPPKDQNKRGKNRRPKLNPIQFRYQGSDITLETLKARLTIVATTNAKVRKKIEKNLVESYYGLATEAERKENLNGDGRVLRAGSRNEAAGDWKDAQMRLEDFIFYQNVMNRWKRRQPRDPTEEQINQAKKLNKPPMLIDEYGDSPEGKGQQHNDFLRQMLNHYDDRGIGTARYRTGNLDTSGKPLRIDGEGFQPRLVPAEELHLWTPRWRRRPWGLGITPPRGLDEDVIPNYEINIDFDSIEQRRASIEDKEMENDTEGLEYKTHSERRKAQRELYINKTLDLITRPSTANLDIIRVEGSDDKDSVRLAVDDRFHRIQTDHGVFIAALECSRDWLTSYDCLDYVQSGSITTKFELSAVRDENFIEHSDTDEPGLDNADRSSLVKAKIDYPYEQREFFKEKELLERLDHRQFTTDWAEATDGRREWHVGMVFDPSSPVLSPPHSPTRPTDPDTIPVTGDDENTFFVDPAIRRCSHNNEQCRAWWTHSPDECWVVHTETISQPTDRLEINPPRFSQIPFKSREAYQARLRDHYGRRFIPAGLEWPRVGVRVPYEPTTIADFRRTRKRKRGAENGEGVNEPTDGSNRVLQGWGSLAVPFITEPQRPWNSDPDTRNFDGGYDVGGGGDRSDGPSSDDENDLFRISYQEGAIINQVSKPPVIVVDD